MQTQHGLNAATDPWLLVAEPGGAVREVSLREALTDARRYSAPAGDPPVVAACLRLLLAIVLDATEGGPGDCWGQWWDRGLPAARIGDYLDRHAQRMHLHGPAPFLQDPSVPEDVGWKSVAELAPHLPTGQNPVIYAHTTDLSGPHPARFTPAEALRWLVAAHQFSRGGMYARVAGSGPTVARPAPLLNKLLTVPTGPSLHHTLMLSLPERADAPAGGPPPWRRTRPVLNRPPEGLVELLTWTTRHVLLAPPQAGAITEMLIAVDPDVDPEVPREVVAELDPHVAATPDPRAPSGFAPARYNPRTAAWRVAPALGTAGTGARAVRALTGRRDRIGAVPVRIETIGLATESHSKYVSWIRRTAPLPVEGAHELAAAVAAAEKLAGATTRALSLVHQRLGLLAAPIAPTQRSALAKAVEFDYWPRLALAGPDLVTRLEAATGPAALADVVDAWHTQAAFLAHRTLDALTARLTLTPRTAEALALGHRVVSAATRPAAMQPTAGRAAE